MYTATYSPDDNKLRLSSASRLDSETYARARELGFRWAPKQEIFVCPRWTPQAEDFLIELAGEIEDDDRSLVERAEERAERFEDYSEKRGQDAERAHAGVSAIADNIPFGQPILVGHHSERHARRDAERIENGMRKAVKMWETSAYWTRRAAGAVSAAKYKERPDVRARRIKKIEAEARRGQKSMEESIAHCRLWEVIAKKNAETPESPEVRHQAMMLAGMTRCVTVPSSEKRSTWTWAETAWDALDRWTDPACTVAQVCGWAARYLAALTNPTNRHYRWQAHYANRLAYERAMLAESGYTPPPKRASKAVLPLLNYPGTVVYKDRFSSRGEAITTEAHAMTTAEWAAINKDYKGTNIAADGTHRVRTCILPGQHRRIGAVYLSDAKTHTPPCAGSAETDERVKKAAATLNQAATERAAIMAANRVAIERANDSEGQSIAPQNESLAAMKEALRQGVQVVQVAQLFPTPAAIAAQMVALADVQAGETVLEPNAGTGQIVRAVIDAADTEIVGYEINDALCAGLRANFPSYKLHVDCADFLTVTAGMGQFPVVLMNPPFQNGVDIDHIKHAAKFLAPGGRLVALCANGPRQQRELRPLVERSGGTWQELPEGTFAEQGTRVRTVMLLIHGAES